MSAADHIGDHDPLRVLDRKLLNLAEHHIGADENVRIALRGNLDQALLALDDRILILKTGWTTGSILGAKANSLRYEQITAVELHAGPINAILELRSPAHPKAGGYWTRDKRNDPTRLPNCITATSATARKWKPYINAIRDRIAQGTWPQSHATPAPPPTEPAHPPPDLAGQLAQLGELHRTGILTADEFEQAKRRLLSGD